MNVSSHAQLMPHVPSGWARKAQIWDGSRATRSLRTPCKACWENSRTPLRVELQPGATQGGQIHPHPTGSSLGSVQRTNPPPSHWQLFRKCSKCPSEGHPGHQKPRAILSQPCCLWQHFGKGAGAKGRQQWLKLLQAGAEGRAWTQELRCSKMQKDAGELGSNKYSQALKWWKSFLWNSLKELPRGFGAITHSSRRQTLGDGLYAPQAMA